MAPASSLCDIFATPTGARIRAQVHRGEFMSRRTQGFTLVEMMLAVVILGALVLIGFPRMSAGMTKANVRGARTTLVNLIAKARTAATQANRVALLKIQGN